MKKRGAEQQTFEIPKDLGHLPNTVGALVPLYWDCIVRFDAAVRAGDFTSLLAIYESAHDVIERAESLPRFQRERRTRLWWVTRYCFFDVARIFDRLTRAAPGTVPLFGQAGWIDSHLSTVRVRFKLDGLCGSLMMGGYGARAWSFEIHAIERNRSFFSGTGYRSFACVSLEAGEIGQDVERWCVGHLRSWWNGEGGKATKYALVRIGERPAPPAPIADEGDDELLVCSTCGNDLSQTDEYGECSEDGSVFCPSCYSMHEGDCTHCLPLYGDEDGDIEPVTQTLTQLSLF